MPTQQESNTSILTELYKYSPSAIVELYTLDLSPIATYYGITVGNSYYYFHNGINEKATNTSVKWGSPELTFLPRSIQLEGIQTSTAGEVPRPTLTVGNHDLFFSNLCKSYANLVGAKVTRTRTFVKFLNATNFISGTNPTADPQAKFPEDVFNIDRVVEEIPGTMTFELAPAWDVEGVMLPRRQVVANHCPWTYKDDPCNWGVQGVVSFNNATGTAGTQTGVFYGVPTTTNGSGKGAKLRVKIGTVSTLYSNAANSVSISTPGYGYTVGNTLTVAGSYLGSGAGNLTVTITAITGTTKYYNENDLIVTDVNNDKCGKRHTSCILRFGTKALPFGGFPSAGLFGKPL
jgi:lambda family phage minor tail protein L